MKKISTILLSIISIAAGAQTLMPVDAASRIEFTIKNFGINTSGTFMGLQGNIKFDSSNLPLSFFNVSVDAKTVNTDVEARDKHLKKEDYFNVDKFPRINFTSTRIAKSASSYTITGNLSIKGISKEISFPFTVMPTQNGQEFKGTFTINRRDFKVGGSSWVLSDNVALSLKVLAK
jgi:polyisoprenoid-binding protein YceI